MSAEENRDDELRALMAEALDTCLRLRTYTQDNLGVFLGDDDGGILDVIAGREKLIDKLIGIEYKTDLIFDEADAYNNGRTLPGDIGETRKSVRLVLDDINTGDMELMKLVSGKMQAYKTETLKARNKKNISAYMKASFVGQSGDSFDFTK